uniref:Uncharacterized protein n=1 Tax=Romanomermis culicivorax TaxID=13658 RepID=A0A915L4W9_ROMCU
MSNRVDEDLKYDCQFIPRSLEQLCLDYLSDKIVRFCSKKPCTTEACLRSSVSPSSSNTTSSPDSPMDSNVEESTQKGNLNCFANNNANSFTASKLLENVANEHRANSTQESVMSDDEYFSTDILHEVFFGTRIAESILSKMNENRCINNDTLKYFRNFRTRIKHFKVQDCKASSLNEGGLMILNEHDLKSLRLINLSGIGLHILVNRILNPCTIKNLELLDLSGTLRTAHYRLMSDSSFSKSPCYHDAVFGNASPSFLGRFINLKTLIVSRSHLDDFALTEICKYLQFLEYLDISSTLVTRLEPLLSSKDRLKTLIAQKHRFKEPQNAAQILACMVALEVLDISVNPKSCSALSQANAAANGADSFRLGLFLVQFLAENPSSLPKLRILDISGGQANFQINAFE